MPEGAIVDADGHVYEDDEQIFAFLPPPYRGRRTVRGFPLWPTLDGFQRGAIHARLGLHASFETSAEGWGAFLDGANLAATFLYPTAGLATAYIRDRDWAVALSRAYNDWLAEHYLTRDPRLHGVALLPVQDPAEAARELRRAVVELGMAGGLLPAAGLERPLGDAAYDPIYAEAERLDRPLSVHGGPAAGLGIETLGRFAQVHTLSHPFAQMVQATSVVMSGVLDRFPSLRIAFLEAGVGWVPFLFDRMDRSYAARRFPEYTGGAQDPPSRYLDGGRIFFGIDPREPALPEVAASIGAGTLLYSSDFPHEVNLDHAREEIAHLAGHPAFDDEAKRALLGGNARRFYGVATAETRAAGAVE